MSASGPQREYAERAKQTGRSAYETAIDVVVTGIVVIMPVVVTIYIFDLALGFVSGALEPLVRLLQWAGIIQGIRSQPFVGFLLETELIASEVGFVSELIALAFLAVVVVVAGLLARHRYGEHVIGMFDYFITKIPGVGAVYRSFRRMGDVMLDDGTENFQSVKVVEFPTDGSYVIGFETAQSPPSICEVTDTEGMVTLFVPLAPNPVMGGFLSHFPEEQVMDVDMTVEEGVRSIVTSGIATSPTEDSGMSIDDLTDLGISPDDLPGTPD
ncbi:DUF502 domain-containing protein [Halogeometricum limi]|uniref:Uncharacterized membrane protein n=1 Tax=Halogeometricum limi TaxID=555875 RepID=A0A1I6G3X2_9EURY|nr:DUF502 domain-containing protein [Halogeometricum limi]SFR36747.1 Uncharacterized membrane protein [Halogeometricum limi]